MTKINIRKIVFQDKDKLVTLFNSDMDTCNWVFKNFAQRPISGYVAETDDRIIGSFIVIPSLLKIGNKVTVAHCAGGAFVEKKYRGEYFIYPKLAMQGFGELKRLKYLSYGFATKEQLSFVTDKNFAKFIKDLPEYMRILNSRFLAKKKAKNKLLSKLLIPVTWLKLSFDSLYRVDDNGDVEIKKISQFDERINDFWERVSPSYQIILVRDREYLNWRYVEKPDKQYTIFIVEKNRKILGYMVLDIERNQEGELWSRIVDLLTINDDTVIVKLLSFTLNFLLDQKVDVVTCLTSDSYQAKILKKFGFVKSNSKILSGKSYSPDVTDGFFLNPDNWFITGGEIRYV